MKNKIKELFVQSQSKNVISTTTGLAELDRIYAESLYLTLVQHIDENGKAQHIRLKDVKVTNDDIFQYIFGNKYNPKYIEKFLALLFANQLIKPISNPVEITAEYNISHDRLNDNETILELYLEEELPVTKRKIILNLSTLSTKQDVRILNEIYFAALNKNKQACEMVSIWLSTVSLGDLTHGEVIGHYIPCQVNTKNGSLNAMPNTNKASVFIDLYTLIQKYKNTDKAQEFANTGIHTTSELEMWLIYLCRGLIPYDMIITVCKYNKMLAELELELLGYLTAHSD